VRPPGVVHTEIRRTFVGPLLADRIVEGVRIEQVDAADDEPVGKTFDFVHRGVPAVGAVDFVAVAAAGVVASYAAGTFGDRAVGALQHRRLAGQYPTPDHVLPRDLE